MLAENASNLRILCPSALSPYLNGLSLGEEHLFFQQWQSLIHQLTPILREGGAPSVFISHAWHMDAEVNPKDTDLTVEEARYYDLMDLQLAQVLKTAGFDVHYDKDPTTLQGIVDEGTTAFMDHKVKNADLILSVCTP